MENVVRIKIRSLVNDLTLLNDHDEYKLISEQIKECITLLTLISDYEPQTQQSIIAEENSFTYEPIEDGQAFAIKSFIGFDDETVISVPTIHQGKKVTTIARGAFKDCKSLKEVQLNKEIEIIEREAFEGCSNLTKIVNTERIKYIGEKAFKDCVALSVIGTLEVVRYIGKEAFANTGLTSFVVPRRITYLGYKLFEGCSELRSVYLHEQVQALGRYCFSKCRKLESVELPQSMVFIGTEAFCDCIALKEVTAKTQCAQLEDNVFSKTSIWQPDLRYNPKITYSPMTEIVIQCLAGSTLQIYCRENGLKCTRLMENVSNQEQGSFSLDYIVGFEIMEPTYPDAQDTFDRLICYLKRYETVVEKTRSEYTGHVYYNIRILGAYLSNLAIFQEYMTGYNERHCKYSSEEYRKYKQYQYLVNNEARTLKIELTESPFL